jgi:hypothetical protein
VQACQLHLDTLQTARLLADLLRRFPPMNSCLDCVFRGQTANMLLGLSLTPHVLATMRQVAQQAKQAQISITNVANSFDCVWSPGRGGLQQPGDAQTEWIGGAGARATIFAIPQPCLHPEPQCFIGTHGAALTNTNGSQALRAIAAAVGSQQPPVP